MGGAEFALLLGFALVKVTIGLGLIWIGLRGGAPDEGEDDRLAPEPEGPPPADPPGRRLRPRRRLAARERPQRRHVRAPSRRSPARL
ncbi:MAG: hypothetical protein M3312_03380 [Actinomycetota bacterium]|nr:hypothetical protein [Actinomycetota bacterium]